MDNQFPNKPPKVFLSHASEDKGRFVNGFCDKLMGRGIDAWLDEREMLLGDDIIDKISEGIEKADAVIIILSKYSVDKPWVKKELNIAMMKSINSNLKIITIRLDKCEVPTFLTPTKWQNIENIQDYQSELDQIVASIFGTTEKPELGESPQYSRVPIDVSPSLTQVDTIIFKKACEEAIERKRLDGGTDTLFQKVSEFDINREQLYESLDVLESENFMSLNRALNKTPFYQITSFGFEKYQEAENHDGYKNLKESVKAHIVNNRDSRSNKKIAEKLGLNIIYVDNILEILADQGLITIQNALSGVIIILGISSKLKRMVEER